MLFSGKAKLDFTIKKITCDEDIKAAFKLADKVFMEFEAPMYTRRGVESFRNFLWGKRVREMLADGSYIVWGCYCGGELAGMLAMRDGEHISLAFVSGEFHRRGIGRKLYAEAKKYAASQGKKRITVNASPYGIPFYRAVGFKETDMQLVTDGIIYTPMEANL